MGTLNYCVECALPGIVAGPIASISSTFTVASMVEGSI